MKEEAVDSADQQPIKRTSESRKLRRRSSSPDVSSRRKDSSKHRGDKSSKRKKERNGSRGDERGRTRKKGKKSKSKKKKKKRSSSRSNGSERNSGPEEGEITESEKEESTRSFSSLSSSPFKECQESEMEIVNPEGEHQLWICWYQLVHISQLGLGIDDLISYKQLNKQPNHPFSLVTCFYKHFNVSRS